MALRKTKSDDLAPPGSDPGGNGGTATALAEPPAAPLGESADECIAVGQALQQTGHITQEILDAALEVADAHVAEDIA